MLVTGAAGMLGSQLLLDAPGSCMGVGTDLVEAPDGAPAVELVGVEVLGAQEVVVVVAVVVITGILVVVLVLRFERAHFRGEMPWHGAERTAP